MTWSISSCFPWLLFVAAFFALCCCHSVQGKCREGQRSLLLQLKHDFNTIRTGNKINSWDSTTDCCEWAGVTCTNGYITGLDLSGEGIDNELSGKSPLFQLQNLTSLSLAQNLFLKSTIPPAFAKLPNLIHLDLSDAGFHGQIPVEISTLTRLVTLDITSKFFYSLKVDSPNLQMLVGNLSNLVSLRLRYVDLLTQSSDWCRVLSSSLPHLQVLDLASSRLSGPIDPSLQNLKSLSIVDLSGNMFGEPFPNFFSNLRNLTYLNLAECVDGKVSEKIFQVPTLRFLDVSKNYQLQGSFPTTTIKDSSLETLVLTYTIFWKTIPDTIGQLKMLSRLDIAHSHLTGRIPQSISQLTNLVSVNMAFNALNCSVPSFSKAKNLRELDLRYNELTGSLLSTDWKQLTHLESILLRNNFLSGSLPTSLFGIHSLQEASLSDNHFNGFTKESISPSSQLRTLYLSVNNLQGEFPSFIFELQGLQELDLSFNNFGSTLQLNSLRQLKNLSSLYLSHSNLVVEMGKEIALFPQLDSLGLASCGLKVIPSFIRNHSVIYSVDMSENQIQGQIPSWIWDVDTLGSLSLSHNHLESFEKTNSTSDIDTIDLSDNFLHGELPLYFPRLWALNLSSNHFNSSLSSIIGSLTTYLTSLDVSKNKLQGSIPDSVCNLTYYFLDLSENFLSGTIPECLPNIKKIHTLNLRKNNLSNISDTVVANCALETLDLSSNSLQGSIPKSLANCTGLEVLDLAWNQLSGTIPKQLDNLKLLSYLNLSYNQLVGRIPKGKQFRKFTEASFEGNQGLCGAPLKKKC